MQQVITCPNCAEKVRAENINIQDKIAVCANCDTVFKFETPIEKAKRRKIKQPQNLSLRDDDKLALRFRTNFLLGRSENFVGVTILALVFSFITSLFVGEFLDGEVGIGFPLAFGAAVLGMIYFLALIAFNHTEIVMDDDSIKVARKPLPDFVNQAQTINLNNVVAIHCEETPKSVKEGYDTPRYNVWAVLADGNRKLIVADMIYDYGFYIAQVLEERLQVGDNYDASRLVDAEIEMEDLQETSVEALSNYQK